MNGLGGIEGLGAVDLLDAGERATFLGLEGIHDEDEFYGDGLGGLQGIHDEDEFYGDGLGGLGDLDTSAWVIDRTVIDAEAASFDARLNAWLNDYAKAAVRLPPAFVQQVDAYVARWRAFNNDWYLVGRTRVTGIVGFESEWNKLRDQFLSYGHSTAIAPAMVAVNGKAVRADQMPYAPDFLTQALTYAKWGGVLLGLGLAYKVTSDLGLLKGVGRTFGKLTGTSGAARAG